MDRVAIWGCGNYTAKVINRDSIPWDAIYVFCDSDVQKQGTFFMGHRVVSPLDIDQNCKKIAIGADIFYPEIFNQALEMYPDKEIVSIDDFEKNFERKKIGAINWNGAALNCQLNESESIKKRCLEGAQLLSDREEPLKLLKDIKVIGEVGVAYGDFSEKLLKYLQPEKFYAIDYFNKDNPYISFWGRDDLAQSGMTHEEWYRNKFKTQISSGQMAVLSGMSWDCLSQQADNTYDYLYIDACHDYESVLKDIEVAVRKVKNKGIIQFNDYTLWDMFSMSFYGVVPAVNKLINLTNSKVLFFCLNKNGFNDIVIELNKEN